MVTSSDTSVFILSGERRSRMALGHLLQQCGTCVHCFTRRKDCLAGLSKSPCDLLIVDCDGDAADGLRVLAEVRRISPLSSSLVLVEPGDTATAVEAMKLGATNCLEKPIQREHLLSAIKADPSGVRPCVAGCVPPLTNAEMRVLRLVVAGKTNRVIGEILHRSPRTVEVHRRNIIRKLGVSGTVGLIKWAAATGLFPSGSAAQSMGCAPRLRRSTRKSR